MKTRTQIQLLSVLATAVMASALAAKTARISQASPEESQGDVIYNGPVVNVSQPAAPQPAPAAQAPAALPGDAGSTQDEDGNARDPHERGLSLGGPRFGLSYISGGGYDKLQTAVKKAKPDAADVDALMTQFGWQMEYRLFRTSQGLTALTEFIPLVGGLDQGLALPSATWLVGLRGKNGFEVGVGPNVGLNGGAMMMGVGYTLPMGGINIPVNLAVGRGAYQTTSLAFSTGFNL
jgi:hypothetical protein